MEQPYPEFPVLMVDDEEHILSMQDTILRSNGIDNLVSCSDSRKVMDIVRASPVQTVLLDLSMPHVSGEELLAQLIEAYPDLPVIVITGTDEVESAVQCMQAGAFDYMVKAVDKNRLLCGVRRAIEMSALKSRYADLRSHLLHDELRCPEAFRSIVTQNRRMRSIFLYVESVAATRETLLIRGETGVGKELFAEAVHRASGRKGDFVAVNTAGLDDSMFADALFGHQRGSFTGATEGRSGLVRQAAGGTLFLDEIGELSGPSQVKLLRLLEKREYYPLGSDLPKSTDARFIVASSASIAKMVEAGTFRKDLFYRISTHDVLIPPLRERPDDLPLLFGHFLEQACTELGKPLPALPPQLYAYLRASALPGNVRELRSMVYDAVSKHTGTTLSLECFRPAKDSTRVPIDTAEQGPCTVTFSERLPSTKEVVDLLVEEALRRANGNQALAAGLVGVTPQALSKRRSRRDRGKGRGG